jgi:type II restriction enzyme
MKLQMPGELAARYKNRAQQARVVTEAWGEENLYCPNCSSRTLRPYGAGTEAFDYACPQCDSPFQLKSQSRPLSARIVDAAYDAMRRKIVEGAAPNLLALHYDTSEWLVHNLVLVPRFVFSLSCLEKRPPLGPKARRAGWVGCNILLGRIPPDARISLISDGMPASPSEVRQRYDRLRPLAKIGHEARGWTLDVLNAVRRLQESRWGTAHRAPTEFTLAEIYEFAGELARLHPQNKNVEPKIRQQLQVLRNMGLVKFLGGGQYRIL